MFSGYPAKGEPVPDPVVPDFHLQTTSSGFRNPADRNRNLAKMFSEYGRQVFVKYGKPSHFCLREAKRQFPQTQGQARRDVASCLIVHPEPQMFAKCLLSVRRRQVPSSLSEAPRHPLDSYRHVSIEQTRLGHCLCNYLHGGERSIPPHVHEWQAGFQKGSLVHP